MKKKLLKSIVQLPMGLQIRYYYSVGVILIATKEVNLATIDVKKMINDKLGYQVVSSNRDFEIVETAAPISQSLSSFMANITCMVTDDEIRDFYHKVVNDLNDRTSGILSYILSGNLFYAVAMTNERLESLKPNLDFFKAGGWK